MFCAGCGTQIQSGLNYCSRCGRRVAEDERPGKSWTNPLVIAGQTAGVGFFAFIFVLLILTKNGAAPNIYAPLAFVYFGALFGICAMVLHYGKSKPNPSLTRQELEEHREPAYLRPVTTAQLDEFREPASVTDPTTRILDEVPLRKN